jgi:hypothetical protein
MADLIGGDRRIGRRYELELGVRFHYTSADRVLHVGRGVTAELSSYSVLLRTEEPPPAGVQLEMWIDWPFLLQGVCPLEVVVKGRVLQVSTRGTVVENESYEFRTRGERSFAETNGSPNTSMIA